MIRSVLALGLALLLQACAQGPGRARDVWAQAPELVAPTQAEDPERVIVLAVDNPQVTQDWVAGAGGYAPPARYGVHPQARALVEDLARRHGLRLLSAWPIDALRWHCVTLLLPAGQERAAVLEALGRDPRVRLAQPLQGFRTMGGAAARYNDPYLPLQSAWQRAQLQSAHRQSTGKGVRLALVDTGVDRQHPDLRQAQIKTRNLVDGDTQQFHRDRHGTELAGLIAATPDNREGIVGMAPQVELLAYKACWQSGSGAQCNSLTLALGLAAALEDGAQVLNLSLSGPRDELLERLLKTALARGLVVLGAVPPGGDRRGFPLQVPGVIAVDLAEAGHERPSGALAAPGRDVLTLEPGGGYAYANGSSLATAQASAVAALLLEAKPRLGARQLAELLLRSAQRDGLIDACAALADLLQQPGACPRSNP